MQESSSERYWKRVIIAIGGGVDDNAWAVENVKKETQDVGKRNHQNKRAFGK